MVKTALLGIATLALAVSASVSDVLEFTDDDFSTRIKDHESALVMFYAPWCGHCKKLKPEFEKAASLLVDNDPPVALAKVDCTEGGKSTCNEFSVSGYPTLKLFKNGEFSMDFNGPRDANGLVKYIKTQVGPSAKTLVTNDCVEAFLGEPDLGVVGFFSTNSPLKKAYLKVADANRAKFRFGVTESKDVLQKYEAEDTIMLFRPKHLHNIFEENTLKYDGPDTKEGVESWLNKHQHGLVDHRQRDNADDFKAPLVVAYYKVDYAKNPKGTNYWRNRILKVASKFTDDFTFAVSSKDDFQHELNSYGYDYVPSDKPLVLAKSADNKKYSMTEEFTMENLEDFLNKLKGGELEPYLKSEPVPESNDGPVKVAVAKNFDEVVTGNGKDTFIEFYAPWCGHCKKLTPVWEELGEKMASEDVEIVKMDATSNDVPPPYDVRGFPTLYWAPKDSKDKPLAYSGGRELNDLLKYVSSHATTELKNYDRSGNPKTKDEL
ncbi:protein disulfide-isomerase A3-like [Cimex lectularius]|uniref:Protein disulfide-isomerase n=1 Tax=Cimex lectularius TaxID=79782 RepID=A0A8I6TEG4_CIMLE|nr:protein disulfide-isomerase A3-like [Cimex lectularius]